MDDGDEVVCLRVVEKDDTIASDRSVEKGRYRAEAEALMKSVQGKNHENKAINVILEFAMGKVNTVIDDMVSHNATHTFGRCSLHIDQSVRASNPRSRHARSKPGWLSRAASR